MEDIIVVKKELDCDIEMAFSMFINNDLLEKWLTVKANVEPKVGGRYELFWEPEDPENNSTIGCRVTGIEKNKFISFDWKGPAKFKNIMNFADPLTHIVVFFSQIPNSEKSIIHLFHTGWRNDSNWREPREYFQKAWSMALEELREKIKQQELF